MTSAFGGQRSIQLSYGCIEGHVISLVMGVRQGSRDFGCELAPLFPMIWVAGKDGLHAEQLFGQHGPD